VAPKEQLQPSNKVTDCTGAEQSVEIIWSGIGSALSCNMFSTFPDTIGPLMEHASAFSQRLKEGQEDPQE